MTEDFGSLAWAVQSLGELLLTPQHSSVAAFGVPSRIPQVLRRIVETQYDGHQNHFARAVGVAKSSVTEWLNGGVVPQMSSSLRICALANISLTGLFQGEYRVQVNARHSNRLTNGPARVRKSFDQETAALAIQRALDQKQAVSVRQVCRDLGCDLKTLRRYFAREADEIGRRRNQLVSESCQLKRLQLMQRIEETGQSFRLRARPRPCSQFAPSLDSPTSVVSSG